MTEVSKPKTKGRGSQSLAKNPKTILLSLNQIAALANTIKNPKSVPYKPKKQQFQKMKYHAVTLTQKQRSNKSKQPAHINEKSNI